MRRLLVVVVMSMVFAAAGFPLLSPARAEGPDDVRVPGTLLLRRADLDRLTQQLQRTVFRATASHHPPQGYDVRRALVYDGAIAATTDVRGGLVFLTSAGWLTGAETLLLLDGEASLPLVLDHIDHRMDLAVLRLADDALDAATFSPASLASTTPMNTYALLAPQTRYEQLVQVAVIERVELEAPPLPGVRYAEDQLEERAPLSFFWRTSLAATNGYPMFDHEGHLVALASRADPVNPTTRGYAIGLEHLRSILEDAASPSGLEP